MITFLVITKTVPISRCVYLEWKCSECFSLFSGLSLPVRELLIFMVKGVGYMPVFFVKLPLEIGWQI